jgi:glutamyl-tRNA reductase
MELFVIGINHRSAPTDIRECFAFKPRDPLPRGIESLLDEHFLFSTCNRAEIYGVANDTQSAVHETKQAMENTAEKSVSRNVWYDLHGDDALKHLFRVASSLDAMVVGEAQVLGQLKDAYAQAMDRGTTGPMLNRVIHRAMRVAKRVRAETKLAEKPISVASVAVDFIAEHLGGVENKTCLVVGAGEVGALVVKQIKSRGLNELIIVNRTFERAVFLAEHAHGKACEWAKLPEALAASDVAIVCTGASQPIIDTSMIYRPMAIIDLGLPRGVDSEVAQLNGVCLKNIDDLKATAAENLKSRLNEAEAAEKIVLEEVSQFKDEMQQSKTNTVIARIHERCEELRKGELDKLYRVAPELDQRERTAIEAATRAIVNKILHDPIMSIKEFFGHESTDSES